MEVDLDSSSYSEFYGGRDDKEDSIEMSEVTFKELFNFYISRNSLTKRKGYVDRLSETLESGARIKQIHQFQEELNQVDEEFGIFYFLNGKLFYDDNATRVEKTNAMGITTDADVPISVTEYEGRIVVCDRENDPFVFPYNASDLTDKDPSGSGVATKISSLVTSTNFVQKAGCVGTSHSHLMFGDVVDFDGTYRPYRLVINRPGQLGTWPVDLFVDLDRSDRIVKIVDHGKDGTLIFMTKHIYVATYVGSGGVSRSPFHFDEVIAGVGLIGHNAIVETDKGIIFISTKGTYFIEKGQIFPRYIGKPIEGFWSDVNKTYRQRIFGVDIPFRNSVMFCVPHGTGQVNNNRGIVINYHEWHQDGPDLLPAYSIFRGTKDNSTLFEFQSGHTIVDPTTRELQVILGNDGVVYDFDGVVYDGVDTMGINCYLRSPYYRPLSKTKMKTWYRLQLDISFDLSGTYTLTFRPFNTTSVIRDSLSDTKAGAPLGAFVLGTHRLGADSLGFIHGDIGGCSRYGEVELDVDESTQQLSIHNIQLFFRDAGTMSSLH